MSPNEPVPPNEPGSPINKGPNNPTLVPVVSATGALPTLRTLTAALLLFAVAAALPHADASVIRGLLDAIDHHHLHRYPCVLELQSSVSRIAVNSGEAIRRQPPRRPFGVRSDAPLQSLMA